VIGIELAAFKSITHSGVNNEANQIEPKCVEVPLPAEFYNVRGKVRLSKVQDELDKPNPDYALIKRAFHRWYSDDEYAIIYHEKEGFRALKCSKRGNDVYSYRVKKRLAPLMALASESYDVKLYEKSGDYSDLLFITLTWDTKICSVKSAWERIGKDYNKFVSALKSRYGKIEFVRAWEASVNGYPHVHLIVKFQDHRFNVVKINNVYRIAEKREFENLWHSFVDIEPVQFLSRVYYLTKYISKELHAVQNRAGKHEQTLSLMWIFRKRAYSITSNFVKSCFNRLDALKHNSNRKSFQITLNGEIVKELPWVFVGIFGKEIIDKYSTSKSNSWYHVLSKSCNKELEQIINEKSIKRY